MNNIYDVRGGRGGDAYLIVGDQKTALIDCGMAYCAQTLIENIKNVIPNRPLDYILLTHAHYDHIGAVPYLKTEWPNLIVLGSEYDQAILKRPNALATIRDLGRQAAGIYAEGLIENYNDDLMKIDSSIAEGAMVTLGNISIKVIETPGHTRCTLSFLINDEILFVSESCGVLSQSGTIYPGFLVSYYEAIKSIGKCQMLHPRFIYSSHYGLIDPHYMPHFWQDCIKAAEESRSFILKRAELGYSEAEILSAFEEVFRDEESRSEQPFNAFRINTQAMIQNLLSTNPA
ncbi:MBL fold metallo-hydrolase [Desulfitobacterium sp.]|uniref:MBL fold metallo-hydrolase n=1 Tax=Desulfitobacterium sp. TaxID=49981 RepID=UPI002B1F1FA8|nr:MBL fold metallo-hydrolase [Desulfitobacterium sp.]MEA4901385.1 MBL fold metallo-hydrolase [Desulfitobacterium sp.]